MKECTRHKMLSAAHYYNPGALTCHVVGLTLSYSTDEPLLCRLLLYLLRCNIGGGAAFSLLHSRVYTSHAFHGKAQMLPIPGYEWQLRPRSRQTTGDVKLRRHLGKLRVLDVEVNNYILYLGSVARRV